jgi:hypothetical protein
VRAFAVQLDAQSVDPAFSIANSPVLVSERDAFTRDLGLSNVVSTGSTEPYRASELDCVTGRDETPSSSSSGITYRSDPLPLAKTSRMSPSLSDYKTNKGPLEKSALLQVPGADETSYLSPPSKKTVKAPTDRNYVDEWDSLVDVVVIDRCQAHEDLTFDDHTAHAFKTSDPNPYEEDEDREFRTSTLLQIDSASSLYQNLVRLSGNPLPPSVSRSVKLRGLLDFHQQHHEFQSTNSFNLMVSLAIAIRDYSSANALIKEMVRRGLHNGSEFRKLSVRFWLRQGKWTEMWVRETDAGKRSIPLPIWIEFLGAVRIFEELSADASQEERQAYREGCASALSSRHTLLMRHRPVLTPTQTAIMPPRAMFSLMQWMLQARERKEAFNLTVTYFQRLPRMLSRSYSRCCTAIMNLHLEARMEEVRELRPLLQKLLSLHPELRPNTDTLWLVLGAVRTRHGNSVKLVRIVRYFQEKWGEEIADERVLSFIADRARRDRFPRVLKKVIQEYERRRERSTPRAWVPLSEAPSNPNARFMHKTVFYDQDKEHRRWEHYKQCLQTLGRIPRKRRKVRKVKVSGPR